VCVGWRWRCSEWVSRGPLPWKFVATASCAPRRPAGRLMSRPTPRGERAGRAHINDVRRTMMMMMWCCELTTTWTEPRRLAALFSSRLKKRGSTTAQPLLTRPKGSSGVERRKRKRRKRRKSEEDERKRERESCRWGEGERAVVVGLTSSAGVAGRGLEEAKVAASATASAAARPRRQWIVVRCTHSATRATAHAHTRSDEHVHFLCGG